MLNHKIYNLFLENCIFISYAPGAMGHAFTRTLYAHDKIFYWNSVLSPWNQWDNKCKTPLDWPDQTELNDIHINYNKEGIVNLKSTIPISMGSFFGNEDTKRDISYENMKKDFIKNCVKPLVGDFLKSGKKLIIPTHETVDNILINCPNNIIINLYANYDIMKKENRLGRNVLKYKESYWKKINHTNVINISKNKYFSKNFNIFKREYEEVLRKLNIGQYKINAVRAFLLRYLERLEQYSEIDRQIALEAGLWDSKNVLSRKGT